MVAVPLLPCAMYVCIFFCAAPHRTAQNIEAKSCNQLEFINSHVTIQIGTSGIIFVFFCIFEQIYCNFIRLKFAFKLILQIRD